ncbi:hypothetical protein LWI29_000297 [Acer saccharum]|uniref:B box-type domain-containing protein n=1 Tax=Acer saccharum TaxID=4024 RepID=A0AA39S4W4_ACESA|nr:hypothetical protein LWI29_000297 [Acer saccharum]
MSIQCNGCELAVADDAALCWDCDGRVHAANKLASKHQRVPLSRSSHLPKCDICQSVGYFFCLEVRALLCSKCDIAIHTANNYVSGHQRFLLTGVKVGLEPCLSETTTTSISKRAARIPNASESTAGSVGEWHLNEYLGLTDMDPYVSSSKDRTLSGGALQKRMIL